MLKLFKNWLVVVGLVSLLLVGVGCSSEPKIDGSSNESFKASVQEIYKSLPEEKAQQFKKVITGMGMVAALATKGDESQMRQFFDGMTYDDVMKKAQEFKNKMKGKE